MQKPQNNSPSENLFIGLMSGTSVDSIDAALIKISPDHISLQASHSTNIPSQIKEKIRLASTPEHDQLEDIASLDIELGHLFAEATNQLISENNIDKNQVGAIGSHGQTIRHRPQASPPFTVQIGSADVIAYQTGITTVANFRARDIAAGGQGAPLVPPFHEAAFSSKTKHRTIVNIGGISNLSILAPDQPLTGFDCGPGNTLMDLWIKLHKQLDYDESGKWADAGTINTHLLKLLLEDSFFSQAPPKSTGKELFNINYLNNKLNALTHKPSAIDVQATLLELTAQSISSHILKYADKSSEIYLCGGGALNMTLFQRLSQLHAHTSVQTTSKLGIDPQWVEAAAFAWLAQKTLFRETVNLSDVTGAKTNQIIGAVHYV